MALTWTLEALRGHFAGGRSREVRGHKSVVHSVAWSLDGRRLASGSGDHTIRLWSLGSMASSSSSSPSFQELRGHAGSVEQVAWSPVDPEVVASLSGDRTLKIWDARVSQAIASHSFPNFTGINLAWDPHGQRIAVGGKDDTVRIVDAASGQELACHRFSVEVNQVTWSPDGALLLLTTGPGSVDAVDPCDLSRTVHRLQGHTSNAYCISWPRHGSLFAVGAADALVSVWDADELACSRTVGRLDWPVRAVALSHCSTLLAAGSEDPFIDVSQTRTGHQVARIPTAAAVSSLAWHPTKWVLAYAAEEMDARSNRSEGNLRIFAPQSS